MTPAPRSPIEDFEPAIKWSGSKRGVAPTLALLVPQVKTYLEPFVGSGAMLPYRRATNAIASDVIPALIELWTIIRDNPDLAADEYEVRWKKLQRDGYKAYYEVRDSFNRTRNPLDLLFLTRTCVNGLSRFNTQGEFNNSLHHTRPGIAPSKLRIILHKWGAALKGVTLLASDYRNVLKKANKDSFVFLDPPYAGNKGRYTPGEFDLDVFFEELQNLNRVGARWMLTFDGSAGKRDYPTRLPDDLYTCRLDLPTGNSPFTKLMRTSIDRVVESVYLNFDPPSQALAQVRNYLNNKMTRLVSLDVQQSFLFLQSEFHAENQIKTPTSH